MFQIAKIIKEHLTDLEIEIVKKGGDLRDYQVDFTRLQRSIAIHQIYNVERAVVNILQALKSGLISDFDNSIYYNTMPRLKRKQYLW